MERQTNETADLLTKEKAQETAAPQFADLQLTETKLDGTKGGPVCRGTTVLAWARVDGVSPQSNHNETVVEDEAGETDAIIDLTVDDATSTQVKGGAILIGLLVPAIQK